MHLCLLDIDGTLVLTGGAGQTAFAQTFARDFGVGETNRDVVFAGRSDRAIAMDLFRIHDIATTAENWRLFCAGYVHHLEETLHTHKGHVLPGVPQLLEALLARGDVAIGLLTGNIHEAARRKLSHYGLWHHFPFGGFGDEHEDRNDIAAAALAAGQAFLHNNGEGWLGSSASGPPATQRPKHWGLAFGSTPATQASAIGHVLVIGDTLNDVRCGRSIGARCVAVATGHSTSDVLATGEPDVVVETLEDVEPILALLNR